MSLTIDRRRTDDASALALLGRMRIRRHRLHRSGRMMIRCLPARVCLSAVTAGLAFFACGDNGRNAPGHAGGIAPPSQVLQINTLSNRADLISGGDALIEIVVPAGSPTATLHVFAGTRDVSAAFSARSDGRTVGLITGLDVGATQIKADLG